MPEAEVNLQLKTLDCAGTGTKKREKADPRCRVE